MALTCLFYQQSSAMPPPSAWRRWSCWTWLSGCLVPLRTVSKWVPALWRWRNEPAHSFSWLDNLTGRHETIVRREREFNVKMDVNLKGTRDYGFYCENLLTPVYGHRDRHLGDRLLSPGRSQLEAAAARALIRDVSMLDLVIETGKFICSGREAARTRTEAKWRSVASRFRRLTAYPRDRNKEDTISGCVAGHLQALLTQDFLSQLRARSRDVGGAVTGDVGHVGHCGHKCQLLFIVDKSRHELETNCFEL